MGIQFKTLSSFNRGILYRLLSDAYSFNSRYEKTCGDKWHEDEDFFFDNKDIGDKYCFITTLDDIPIGFLAWDPRNLPEYAIIGDNCVIPAYKGLGYGKLQLQEAVSRITARGAKRIYVSTDYELIPAQKMYESVGFKRLESSSLEPWQWAQSADIYYCMEVGA